MAKKLTRTCVLIAGMHRSGTSALSRVLGIMGCAHPKSLLEANSGNQTGYWESERLSYFNDDILEAAGSSWDDWASCSPDWIESPIIADFERRAMDMYNEEYGEASLTVFKDPRLCRLLPFWLPLLEGAGITTQIIIPIRNPKEVASSLLKRNGIDVYYSHLFWLRHVLEAEAASRGRPRAIVTYSELLENYATVIAKTETQLGMKWPKQSPKMSEQIEAYLSTEYRHEQFSTKSVLNDPSCSDWLRQTYEIMINWAEAGENSANYPALDRILGEINTASTRFGRLIYRGKGSLADLIEVRKDVLERDNKLATFEQDLIDKEQALAKANDEILLREQQLNQAIVAAEVEFAAHAQASGETEAQLTTAMEEAEALRRICEELRADADVKGQSLETIIAQQEQALAELRADADAKGQSLETIIAQQELALTELRADADVKGQSFEAMIAQHETALAVLQFEVVSGEGRTEDLMAQLSEERDTYAHQINALKEELATSADLLIASEANYRDKLAETSAHYEAVVTGIKDTFALADKDNSLLSKKLHDAEEALQALEQARRSQMFEMNQVRSSLAQKKAEADDYHFAINKLDAEKIELTNLISEIKTDLQSSKERGAKLALQLQSLVNTMDGPKGFSLIPKRFKRAHNKKIVGAVSLVDTEWYLKTNPDVASQGLDPTLHYVSHGAAEGRSPNADHDKIVKM